MELSLHQYVSEERSRILDTANLCMKIIEEAGLSKNEALDVPQLLEGIIKRSNRLMADKEPFKAKRVKVEHDGNGGIGIIDLD